MMLIINVDTICRRPHLHPCITRIQSLPSVLVPAHRGLRAGVPRDDHRGDCGGDVQSVGVYFFAVICLSSGRYPFFLKGLVYMLMCIGGPSMGYKSSRIMHRHGSVLLWYSTHQLLL